MAGYLVAETVVVVVQAPMGHAVQASVVAFAEAFLLVVDKQLQGGNHLQVDGQLLADSQVQGDTQLLVGSQHLALDEHGDAQKQAVRLFERLMHLRDPWLYVSNNKWSL